MTARHPLQAAASPGCGEAASCRRAESRFLAAISHEFRTPIHGVIGLAELLADARLAPAEREYVALIHQCARSLLALVDNALDLSHMERGRLRLEDAEIDLQQLLRDLAGDFALRLEQKQIAFESGTDAAVPAWIRGDAARLRQVLHNLLDNALKFTDAGSIALDVHVRQLPAGERLAFAVHDTGIGIAPADQPRLFTRFATADGAAAGGPTGAGLGLAISRELARCMGGDIEVASRLGEGATFTLVLPLRPLPAGSAGTAPGRTDACILLVEDNAVNQVVARGLLENLGHRRVTLAGDGLQALEACAGQRFDLVLMDCQMPRMDGLRATALLRERGVTTPIVALTASPVVGDRDRCLAAGMDDYLTKPLEPGLLARKLAQWLPPASPPSQHAALATPMASAAPAFEQSAAQERFCGDTQLFRECRDIFLWQTPQRLDEAQRSLAAGDAQQARFLAHTLRGSAATLGAQRLAHCCRRIEQDLDGATPDVQSAGAHLDVARTAFADFVEASQTLALP